MIDYVGKRVEIPAHTDAWMSGDRFGEIVDTTARPVRKAFKPIGIRAVAMVKLDKSGRTVKFDLADLTIQEG